MGWNNTKINNHLRAANLLCEIKDKIFKFIAQRKSITEYEVQQFILRELKKHKMKMGDKYNKPIVAFRENTSFVHYYPKKKSKKLKPESLILVDIWARLEEKHSPFADITWMGYYGKKIPQEVLRIFNIIIKARDEAIKYIGINLSKRNIPNTCKVDKIARNVIKKNGYKKNFLHSTGHSLGFTLPHGGKRISPTSKGKIIQNIAYTIEPGIYLKEKYGVRSEIDFYINNDMEIKITTNTQKEIIRL